MSQDLWVKAGKVFELARLNYPHQTHKQLNTHTHRTDTQTQAHRHTHRHTHFTHIPDIAALVTMAGPKGQKVSNVFPSNHCLPFF